MIQWCIGLGIWFLLGLGFCYLNYKFWQMCPDEDDHTKFGE
jgi:hypothetical protein